MSTLLVRIEPPEPAVGVDPPAPLRAGLVARLTRLPLVSRPMTVDLDGMGGTTSMELVLGIGDAGRAVEVAPGLWNVELALPSGELRAEQVWLDTDGAAEIAFDLGEAPRDWLSWQFVEGSVPGRERYDEVLSLDGTGALQSPRGFASGKVRLSPSVRRNASLMFDTPVVQTDAFALSGRARAIPAVAQVSMLELRTEVGDEGWDDGAVSGASAWWMALGSGLRMEDGLGPPIGLASDPQASFLPGEADRWHEAWRLSSEPEDDRRRFALVVSSWAVELVSLPLPWPRRRASERASAVELVIDKSEVNRPSRTSVTLRDPALFGLLSYLKSGAFASAGLVARRGPGGFDLLVDVLRRKRANPLAACAAGYALLAGTDLREPQPWQDWLANLDDWFGRVPDGALLYGRLLLARGGRETAAMAAYLRAFERGLPYYALGVSWLLEGLRQFPGDARCVEAASLVREVALRSDVSQAFTVLKARPPADLGLEG